MASAKSSSALALLRREDQNEVIVSNRAMAAMAFRIQAMTIFLTEGVTLAFLSERGTSETMS